MAQQNPILGTVIGALLGGIPSLIGGIQEKNAARKAEKLAAAGTQTIGTGLLLGGVVENTTLIQQGIAQVTDNGIYLPAELVELHPGFTIAYIAIAVVGLGIKAYAKHVATTATKQP